MPINKNAFIRYRVLDRCFRDKHRRYFIDDLIEECEKALIEINFKGGGSRRQDNDDIRIMKSVYEIDLDELREGKRKYYRYKNTDFSINQQPISKAEAQQLQQAISTLTRFRGLPQYGWIEEVITNLEHRFNLDGKSVGVVCFEQNRLLKGLEYLGPLIDAATEHKVLKVNYHNYKNGGRDMDFILHTYYLKQYNNRWFAFGFNEEAKKITIVALDRIQNLEPMNDIPFKVNKEIDFDHYFDDIIGVTIPDDPTVRTIIFRTNEGRYHYIASKPLHHSQRLVDRKQHILRIDVAINNELEQKMLSFGPDIEVLEPQDFREQMKKKIKESIEKYDSVQNDCTDEL